MKVFDDKEYLTIFIPAQKANFERQNLHDFNIVGGRFVDFSNSTTKENGLPNLRQFLYYRIISARLGYKKGCCNSSDYKILQ